MCLEVHVIQSIIKVLWLIVLWCWSSRSFIVEIRTWTTLATIWTLSARTTITTVRTLATWTTVTTITSVTTLWALTTCGTLYIVSWLLEQSTTGQFIFTGLRIDFHQFYLDLIAFLDTSFLNCFQTFPVYF